MKKLEDIAPENKVLILRTCKKGPDGSLTGYGGFPWPSSGPVEAPNKWDNAWGKKPSDYIGGFKPNSPCGGGLHGLEEAEGDLGLLDWTCDGQAMLVSTDRTKLVRVGVKVKFRSGVVERLVSLAEGICMFWCDRNKINKQVKDITAASGSYSKLAASGSYSKLAASGHDSKLAASGSSSKLAASGSSSKLAASGHDSQLAASGSYSQLAASGSYSKLAASGSSSICMAAAYRCRAKASANGAIALAWYDEVRPRIAVGYVGENGIESDTWYKVSDNGTLIAE